MSGQPAPELPKRRMPRTGTTAPFIVDRQTIEALPSQIHKKVASLLVAEGSWIVKDAEENEVVQ